MGLEPILTLWSPRWWNWLFDGIREYKRRYPRWVSKKVCRNFSNVSRMSGYTIIRVWYMCRTSKSQNWFGPSINRFYYQGLQKVKTCIRPPRSKFCNLGLQKVKTCIRPSRSKFNYLGLQRVKICIRPSRRKFWNLRLQKVKIWIRPSRNEFKIKMTSKSQNLYQTFKK